MNYNSFSIIFKLTNDAAFEVNYEVNDSRIIYTRFMKYNNETNTYEKSNKIENIGLVDIVDFYNRYGEYRKVIDGDESRKMKRQLKKLTEKYRYMKVYDEIGRYNTYVKFIKEHK
jgi:hypothetical protein